MQSPDDEIREAFKSLPALRALADTKAWDGFSDLKTARRYSCHGLASFLLVHGDHKLTMVSEYGEEEPLTSPNVLPCGHPRINEVLVVSNKDSEPNRFECSRCWKNLGIA